jgi:hypothetical protein
MKKIYTIIVMALCLSYSASTQVLLSFDHLRDLTAPQVDSIIGTQGPYGVTLYRVVYTLLDHNDVLDTASGLFAAPIDPLFESSLVIYNHGTTQEKQDVPSNLRAGLMETLGFATFGFVTASPDYVGMGEMTGFHPYVHAESEAAAGLYFIDIAYEIMGLLNISAREELFLAGYSQGAHASMALQKKLETEFNGDIAVTACAHGSGPYSIGEVMRELIIADEVYLPVGFVPYFILGYQEAYGDLYNNLNEIFKPQYVSLINLFVSGDLDLTELSTQIAFNIYFENAGRIVPKVMLQDSIVDRLILNDDDDQLIQYLRANNTYDFQASVPTRLYYCEADDVVPFENSILADSVMQDLGATDLALVHVNPAGSHGQCAIEALPLVADYFLSFLNVGVSESEAYIAKSIFPNPVSTDLNIQLYEGTSKSNIKILDLSGRTVASEIMNGDNLKLDVSTLAPGLYIVQFNNKNGRQVMRFMKY